MYWPCILQYYWLEAQLITERQHTPLGQSCANASRYDLPFVSGGSEHGSSGKAITTPNFPPIAKTLFSFYSIETAIQVGFEQTAAVLLAAGVSQRQGGLTAYPCAPFPPGV